MIGIDKQDLDEQLNHLPKIILALRRRLRARELQEAEYGILVPPEVTNEIIKLNERISKHEAELARRTNHHSTSIIGVPYGRRAPA